jgi:carbamoyl-phosphate synthase large subunit
LGCDQSDRWGTALQPASDEVRAKLATPNAERPFFLRYALKLGLSPAEIHDLTAIDPWFIQQLVEIVECEEQLRACDDLSALGDPLLRKAKRLGFSDRQLGWLLNAQELDIRAERKRRGIVATFKSVDTCAAEFEAYTPYYYSTYEDEDEAPRPQPGTRRIVILGGGPNRIGQGIEFDYCCCHASFALRELGIESVMVNSNPETVSTDYDTSDILFFEPLTVEDVLNICDCMQPEGVFVQFGGQTPLNLARALHTAGVPILGTSVDTIEAAEDRELFQQTLERLQLHQPSNAIARNLEQARLEVRKVGYPALVRPSYVIGGRAMEICYDELQFERFVAEAFAVAQGQPVLIDRFLEDATEVDVDAISDGQDVVIMGIMEHIEAAGVHSGDSACVLPHHTLPQHVVEQIRQATRAMALRLKVVGLMNMQFAVKKEQGEHRVYVLEANPRASRTVPFVAKATNRPWAKWAAKVMAGAALAELTALEEPIPSAVSVKESVFPFRKFAGVDIVLGPEMRSTGEVMGIDSSFAMAFAKSQLAAGVTLPEQGRIFLSVIDRDKPQAVALARRLISMGYQLLATAGTARALEAECLPVVRMKKIAEGQPNILDQLIDRGVSLVLNTPKGKGARTDEGRIRAAAVQHGVPCITTIQAAEAAVFAMEALRREPMEVRALQDYADRSQAAATAAETAG